MFYSQLHIPQSTAYSTVNCIFQSIAYSSQLHIPVNCMFHSQLHILQSIECSKSQRHACLQHFELELMYTRQNPRLLYRCASGSSVTFCDSLTSAASPLGPSGYERSLSGMASIVARCLSLACIPLAMLSAEHQSPLQLLHLKHPQLPRGNSGRTKGIPQYVHQLICGLSVLMKMRGCPRGPPPPSQDTTLSCVQRTGCLWISSMAA